MDSFTGSMLAELETAIDSGAENVAVALWQPHWAYAAYPIQNLADPGSPCRGTLCA